jgi:hypothetical protein
VLGCCSVSIMCSKDNNNIVAEVNERKSCQTLYSDKTDKQMVSDNTLQCQQTETWFERLVLSDEGHL